MNRHCLGDTRTLAPNLDVTLGAQWLHKDTKASTIVFTEQQFSLRLAPSASCRAGRWGRGYNKLINSRSLCQIVRWSSVVFKLGRYLKRIAGTMAGETWKISFLILEVGHTFCKQLLKIIRTGGHRFKEIQSAESSL